ncbi:histidine phosphatase family protein [Quadrisphaera sp. DSM 44207]|uniref:histidine phosphatase family protein n=1 Tax=Quadrisphaera sp. DSM 44207 TaxID=1881057 RepID=UPI000B859EF8|nr:histidine phosphatase family protein [Quadrisphaera sp. DSM 44207]
MPTLLLVRHGRTAANAGGVLAGRTPGVDLDDAGRAQVAALAQRLAPLPLAAVVSSPLQRCRATAAAITGAGGTEEAPRPGVDVEDDLSECDYGSWTGRPLKELTEDPLWPVVQAHPSAVTFPDGESMRTMQSRALDVVRRVDARVAAEHGAHAVWVAVSHGDVIKAVLADALGMHLDAFQRIVVDPASVSVVRYTPLRPFAVRVNDTGGDVSGLLPPAEDGAGSGSGSGSDAAVGGGAGPGTAGSGTTGPGTTGPGGADAGATGPAGARG